MDKKNLIKLGLGALIGAAYYFLSNDDEKKEAKKKVANAAEKEITKAAKEQKAEIKKLIEEI